FCRCFEMHTRLCCLSSAIALSTSRRAPLPAFYPYTPLFRSVVAGDRPCGVLARLPRDAGGGTGAREPAGDVDRARRPALVVDPRDRKSTRLNSSHVKISYAGFCLKKKNLVPTPRREWPERQI